MRLLSNQNAAFSIHLIFIIYRNIYFINMLYKLFYVLNFFRNNSRSLEIINWIPRLPADAKHHLKKNIKH